jgi:2-iminoacetate synthase
VGITHTSAGSHTEPGGYEHPEEAEGQFEVADHRSPGEVAASLRDMGYDPVWEDPSTPEGIARALARR